MQTDMIDVGYVADLARLQLSPEETAKFQKQLGDILDYVRQIQQVDVSKVPDHAIDPNLPTNALRLDKLSESLSREDALLNAPARANDLISTPKIVE
ncbi:MAG: Asp-tRNA(Asn)/Glu-tRNA(Gln) amidotransferase subunit GatC [Verrucomicrobiota bacterium]